MNKVIYTKALVEEKEIKIKEEISKLSMAPTLQVIQVGDNAASNSYIGAKRKACQRVGINFELLKLNESVMTDEVMQRVGEANNNKVISGILVQLPLPEHIDKNIVINKINPNKDVDGLTLINVGKLNTGQDGLYPCTALGIINLLKYKNVNIAGKTAVVVGRSNLVGKPTAALLQKENATVTICHSKTIDIEKYTKEADILVVAIGQKQFIKKHHIKPDAVLIDVGITKYDDKLYGDIDLDDVIDKCKMITPVPKGVGPMTVLTLLENILKAHKNNI